MFAVGLSYIAFIMLRYVPSIPAFWRVFIINGCWILSKAFSASIEIIIWFLFFSLLMWWITLIDLRILKNPCIPGIKPIWSWCMIFWTCCWILIAVAKTSKTMLNSSGKSGHPCLVPDFRRNVFNFSPLRIMFAVGLSYIAFIMLRYVPSISAFWRFF